jgi:hypothetical protein
MASRTARSDSRAHGRADALLRREVLRFREDTFGQRNWGHRGLRASLRGVSLEEARWKPGPSAHSVWEHVNHVAHGKRYVLERVRARSRAMTQAWPPGGGTAAEFRRAIAALERLHRDLRRAIGALTPEAAAGAGGRRYSATRRTTPITRDRSCSREGSTARTAAGPSGRPHRNEAEARARPSGRSRKGGSLSAAAEPDGAQPATRTMSLPKLRP